MTRYSVQPRGQTFEKGYGFSSFAKNVGKNIGKNISKNLRGKYSQKLLNHSKQSTTDALKTTSKRVLLTVAETTGDLIGNKIANRMMKVSQHLQQNNSETVTNENDKDMPKGRFISPEEKHKFIDDL